MFLPHILVFSCSLWDISKFTCVFLEVRERLALIFKSKSMGGGKGKNTKTVINGDKYKTNSHLCNINIHKINPKYLKYKSNKKSKTNRHKYKINGHKNKTSGRPNKRQVAFYEKKILTEYWIRVILVWVPSPSPSQQIGDFNNRSCHTTKISLVYFNDTLLCVINCTRNLAVIWIRNLDFSIFHFVRGNSSPDDFSIFSYYTQQIHLVIAKRSIMIIRVLYNLPIK